jgi:hypothetical protein
MSRFKMEPPSPAIAAALLRRFEAMSLDAHSEVVRSDDQKKASSQLLLHYADLTGERAPLVLRNGYLLDQCADQPLSLHPHAMTLAPGTWNTNTCKIEHWNLITFSCELYSQEKTMGCTRRLPSRSHLTIQPA